MQRLATSTFVVPALALLLGTVLWLGQRSEPTPSPAATVEPGAERPRYQLDGAQWLRHTQTGQPMFEVRARRVDYFDDGAMQMMTVEVDQLATDGSPDGHWALSAPRGSVAAGEHRLQLYPQVEIQGQFPRSGDSGMRTDKRKGSNEPLRIQTPQLWVDWRARTLDSDQPVTAVAPGRRLQAVGLHADWTGRRVAFLHDVQVTHAARAR